MSLPANWDQRLNELTRGCTEEEKSKIYHRLIVMFGWKCLLDLKKQGKLTPEATAKFMRSMDEEDAKLKKEREDLVKGLQAFKSDTLDLGEPVDVWTEEVTKQSRSILRMNGQDQKCQRSLGKDINFGLSY